MRRVLQGLMVIAVLLAGVRAGAQPESNAGERGIDPEAEAIIRALSKRMAETKNFRVEVVDTIDSVLDTGQKVQYSHQRVAGVSRPDRLFVRSTGDVMNRTMWKDGKTITIVDRDHNVYVQTKAPGTIDDMLDMMSERFGVSVPLADLFSADPYAVLMKKARSGDYLGIHNVDGNQCHHVAFQQDDIDWQAWIDAEGPGRLRKLVITYKQLPQAPQYTVTLKSFMAGSKVPADAFKFKLPVGCERIELLEVETPKGGPGRGR